MAYSGLSPRVRGNPERCSLRRYTMRSIPACAGEPCRHHVHRRDRWVYPRVCGGTAVAVLNPQNCHGLSPRVRGNLGTLAHAFIANRSIPACAGEPVLHVGTVYWIGVYPRVCGGTADITVDDFRARGLSPRVRGNLNRLSGDKSGLGSIPACAGEPYCPTYRKDVCKVYPRVCGGTISPENRQSPSGGLSPRVRGNLQPRMMLMP